MAQIGIIGGGISGLTLAFLLKEKGHSVRVFESTDQPGGAIKTTRDRQGWMAEWGPNTIIESSGRIKRLIAMLALEENRCYPDALAKRRYIVRDQRMVAVPGSLSELIHTPLLSRRAKWSLFREPFVNRKTEQKSGQLGPENFRPDQPNEKSRHEANGLDLTNEESIADFVRRRLGEEFLKWPVDALVGGIYAGDPEKLSVRHAFPRLALLEKQHGSLLLGQLKGGVRRPAGSDEIPRNKAEIFSFDEGLQLLPQTLNRRLGDAVLCNAAVRSVSYITQNETEPFPDRLSDTGPMDKTDSEKKSGHWEISFASSENPPETFDVLVYAGTAHGIDKITFPLEMTSNLDMLTDIPHPPVVSLTLGFRRSDVAHPLNGFGVLVPGVEQLPILGTLFTSSLFSGRAPDRNHVTLTTYLGGMRQPDIAGKSEEEHTRLVCDTLQKLLGVTGKPQFRHRIVWPEAIPQYHLDHQRYLDSMDQIEQNQPGFYLAGNYRTGISVGDTINAAFDLADRISNDLAKHKVENLN